MKKPIIERLINKRLMNEITALSDDKITFQFLEHLQLLDKKSFIEGYKNGYNRGFCFGLLSTLGIILTSELFIFLLYKIITI